MLQKIQIRINVFVLHKLQVCPYLTVNLMILLILFFHILCGGTMVNYVDGPSVLIIYGIYLLD
jgi:hypothetical protein